MVGEHERPDRIVWNSMRVTSPWMSEKKVLPVLDSIVDQDDSLLQHLQFPQKWLDEKTPVFHEFMKKYNAFMHSKETPCSCCDSPCRDDMMDADQHDQCYGLQSLTCYKCMQHCCDDCRGGGAGDDHQICHTCKKAFCGDCVDTWNCDSCLTSLCTACGEMSYCEGCGECYCEDCGH